MRGRLRRIEIAALWVIGAVAVSAGWIELATSNDLLNVNTGQAVFFTLAALAAPGLATAMYRRHSAESTGALLGLTVLAAMLGACRSTDLGPVSSIAGVVALVLVLLPAVVVVRYPALQCPRAVVQFVTTCFWASAAAGATVAVIVLVAGSVPSPLWYADPTGRGPGIAITLLGIQAVIVTVAAGSLIISHYVRWLPLNARRALRPLMLPAIGWCVSATTASIWTVVETIRVPLQPDIGGDASTTYIVLPTVLVGALAAGFGWIDLTVRNRSAPRAVSVGRSGIEANVEQYLSRALADPSIRVLYPIEGGAVGPEWVNAAGQPATVDHANHPDRPDRAATVIRRGPTVIGLIDQDAAITARPDAVELIATGAGLIMETERFLAASTRDLEQARLLAERLLSASDEPRARLRSELLAGPLTELDAISESLRDGAGIGDVVQRLTAVAAHVRTISHGVFPAALTAGGLRAALAGAVVPDRRYAPVIEMTAYLAAFGDDDATIEETTLEDGPGLRIGTAVPPSADVCDRVSALGGTVERADLSVGRWSITVPNSVEV